MLIEVNLILKSHDTHIETKKSGAEKVFFDSYDGGVSLSMFHALNL